MNFLHHRVWSSGLLMCLAWVLFCLGIQKCALGAEPSALALEIKERLAKQLTGWKFVKLHPSEPEKGIPEVVVFERFEAKPRPRFFVVSVHIQSAATVKEADGEFVRGSMRNVGPSGSFRTLGDRNFFFQSSPAKPSEFSGCSIWFQRGKFLVSVDGSNSRAAYDAAWEADQAIVAETKSGK